MWESQGEEYWKARQKPKGLSGRVKAGIAGAIVLIVVVVALVLWRRPAVDEVSVASDPVKLSDEPIRLQSLTADQKQTCLRNAAEDENRWIHKECKKQCGPTRNTLPRPTAYRACMDGCQDGSEKAINIGCNSITTVGHCQSQIHALCTASICKPYASMFPRPALYDICRQNCQDSLHASCDHATKMLEVVRKGREEL
uniref:Uncharacterized protein n=1 Tax=Rhizochromulina marina TaxID=1034831 RepID=A0A7S2S8M6_9STRA|mmetsp:Transcript_26714/g.77738  ORF Transcript_26714/g.77738 Transcript_26714/m.77738 type:complete len:198 (+) Transcript_26714:123-716(+)|eukprot:CAMPEP_0118978152 /NCGR_PEP_ID=MMETSP1173-20130426/23014_1 /TAXON_ID=1034831 /ORGANISM="Rhizochromulina marina cf, Strain CCMP1243" /LENGTH=197 /DNA_ID=CAMNT_0006928331 /DNA_START=42 /DNA_END=635 /DNA_ORIENTATION=+